MGTMYRGFLEPCNYWDDKKGKTISPNGTNSLKKAISIAEKSFSGEEMFDKDDSVIIGYMDNEKPIIVHSFRPENTGEKTMVAKQTSEQIEAKKLELLSYSEQDLLWLPFKSDDKEKKSLYKLGIGLIDGISKMKKHEALEALKSLRDKLKSTDTEIIETAETAETTDTEIIETAETTNTEVIETAETIAPKVDFGEVIGNEDLADFCQYIHKKFIKVCDNSLGDDGYAKPEILTPDLSDLAYELYRYIDEKQNRDGDNISASHKMALRTNAVKIIDLLQEKLLRESKGSINYVTYKSSLPVFYSRLNKHFNEISQRRKVHAKSNLSTRRKQSSGLDFKPIYEYAVSRLSNLEKFNSKDWVEVSVALAIVTGRRLSELHHSDTKIELITDDDIAVIKEDLAKLPKLEKFQNQLTKDVKLTIDDETKKLVSWISENFRGGNFNAVFYQEYIKGLLNLSDKEFKKKFVKFTGQQKVSGKKSESKDNLVDKYYELFPSYFIPVMMLPELVVNAHKWLIDNNKVCDELAVYDARKLKAKENAEMKKKENLESLTKGTMPHRRYSGDLAKYMKIWREKIGISQEYETQKLTKEVFTYKSLRAIYGNVFGELFGVVDESNNTDYFLLLAAILGHSRADAMLGKALSDSITPQSYASDFKVKNFDVVWN